jgi:hypothetical protein
VPREGACSLTCHAGCLIGVWQLRSGVRASAVGAGIRWTGAQLRRVHPSGLVSLHVTKQVTWVCICRWVCKHEVPRNKVGTHTHIHTLLQLNQCGNGFGLPECYFCFSENQRMPAGRQCCIRQMHIWPIQAII